MKGAPVVAAMNEANAARCAALKEKGIVPTLAVVRVGAREDDISYEKGIANLVSIDMTNSNATAIPDYTFTQKKYLLNVRLPQELRSIGQRAFSGCGRLCGTLVLPASVTAIEYGAFMGCDNLRYVLATGNKITTLGDNLFGESQGKIIYKEKQ